MVDAHLPDDEAEPTALRFNPTHPRMNASQSEANAAWVARSRHDARLTMPRRAPARGYRTAIVNELARAHALLAQGPLLFPQ